MAELRSWKEIASYLEVSVRTAQMWEAQRGLPVRRLPGPRGRVLAVSGELDAWRLSGEGPAQLLPEAPSAPARSRRPIWTAAAIAAALLAGTLVRARFEAAPPEFAALESHNFTTDYGQEFSPSLSPDGERTAYLHVPAGHDSGPLLVRSSGSPTPLSLAQGFTRANFVLWSPDGARLAFTRNEGPAVVLEVIRAEGGPSRRLATLRGQDRVFNLLNSQRPGWFPNGQALCLSDRDSEQGPLHLYRLNIANGSRAQLTVAPPGAAGDAECTPSPDGSQIAFARYSTASEAGLYVLDASSGQLRRVSAQPAKFDGLAWLPGGRAVLAGASINNMGSRLWVFPLDGAAPKMLTGAETFGKFPSVLASGDGVKVLYETGARDENIWRWSRQSGAQQVTRSRLADVFPNISLQGELAFISRRAGPPELFLSLPDGSQPHRATQLGGGYIDFPRWSPDGQLIAFAYPNGGDRDIVIWSRGLGAPVPIRRAGSEEGRASFSHDGRRLYFRSNHGGAREIYRSSAEGPTLPMEQVTHGGGYEAFEDPYGRWLYYVKERDRPGLWRMPVSGGPTSLISDQVWEGRWAIGPDGVYFLATPGGAAAVMKLGWQGGKPEIVFRLPEKSKPEAGLSVSADGQWVYWAQLDGIESDIMTGFLR